MIARENLSFGARQLEMRLAELTMLSAKLTANAAKVNHSAASTQALEIRRQRAEVRLTQYCLAPPVGSLILTSMGASSAGGVAPLSR